MADYSIEVAIPTVGPQGPAGPAGAAAPLPIVKWKEADQSVTDSTTLVDDDTLFFATEAGARYFVRLFLMVDGLGGATGTHAFEIVPSDASVHGTWRLVGGNFGTAQLTTLTSFNLGGTSPRSYYVSFTVEGGATAGEVKLRWAQGTAIPTASFVKEGSVLIAEKLP